MSYLAFSKRWANYLAVQTGLSSEKVLILTYVIEVLALNLLSVIMTLLLGLLIGVLPGTAACVITGFIFRHTAGGAHSNSPWRCGVITITIYPLIALLAASLSGLSQLYFDILLAVSMLLGLVAVILLAPVDSPSAPIISPARRKKMKLISVMIVLMLAMLLLILQRSQWVYARQVQLCVAFSIIWVSLMLSKQGYQLISLIDNI
ncbi:MAG: putative accessory gene regulator protein [Pelotomaculum sp. PtaU1.Bin035]|nr:MAG: putative accessory gene regulator protein [Pelotomaculum sp. PtaU1.Bin035]